MKKTSGFTLIEILISVGILAIVSTLLAQVLFTTTHINKKTEILTDMKQDGNFALGVIGRMVRAAKSIDVCDAHSLTITNPDTHTTTFTCAVAWGTARIASQSAAGASVNLTGPRVTVSPSGGDCTDSSLAFSCSLGGGEAKQVSISFSLRQSSAAGGAYDSGIASFQSTVGLRN